jgi:septal ring factor EnvC (AmiA/AmiB activator)
LLLSKLLYQQYLGGKQEYLKLLLNNHDPNQVARELQYYDYIARNRADWIKSLRGKLHKVQTVSEQTQQKSKEILALQNEEHLQRQHLENEKRLRQQTLTKFATQLKQQHREIGRLQRDENRLSQLVDKLAKMLSPAANNQTAHNKLPDSNFDGKPFASLKGKLFLPVKGNISNKFGTLRPDSRVLWKGLFVRSTANQPVKSVAAGRVVFADWLRGFGNLIIVDHGQGYMSLYGNNETLFKQVGDTLHGGDTIASIGNSGGNEESGLYFELRHEGIPFDPLKWISR